jgi:DNA-binding YbaB/EbfC family protein
MNIQAMMKQAQKLQKEMMEQKSEIDSMIFESKSSFVTIKMKGTKEIIEVKIESDSIEKDDIELLQDMIMIATNDCIKKIDEETEKKLGKYTQGMPGLF